MATARLGERERFVRDFWKHHGVRVEGGEVGVLRVDLPAGLRRKLRAQELVCAFQPEDLEEHPEAELMVPGNPVFDRILAVARDYRAVSRRYARSPRELEAVKAAHDALPGRAFEQAQPRYRSSFLFTFHVGYRSIESFDEIRAIMVSGSTGRCQTGESFFRGLNLTDGPEEGILDEEPADVEGALGGALGALEEEIAATVEDFAREAELHLKRERERLQGFFTALIAEEKSSRRAPTQSSVGAAERKLEWVQRIEQDNRLFAPRAQVELIGLQEIKVPVVPVRIRLASGEMDADVELTGGELLGVSCGTCGLEIDRLAVCEGGEHPTCDECLTECAACRR